VLGNSLGSGPGVSGTSASGPGVQGNSATGQVGVFGNNTGNPGGPGVLGQTSSTNANTAAVAASNFGPGPGVSGTGFGGGPGVQGTSSGSGAGVSGSSAGGPGVQGSASSSGPGVQGNSSTSQAGVQGNSATVQSAVVGSNTGGGAGVLGVSGFATIPVSANAGVSGLSENGPGVFGTTSSTDPIIAGVGGANNGPGPGVSGTSVGGNGVVGTTTAPVGSGVYGSSPAFGVQGLSTNDGYGVQGSSSGTSGAGVKGESDSGAGVVGLSTTGPGVLGEGSPAGQFLGDVSVAGTLSASSKSFRIDHPLDPANKYLVHACVESSEMLDVYRGTTVLDANGEAVLSRPSWFAALNRDFSYHLTAIGAPAPDLHVAEEVTNNACKIAGGKPGMKVSWQITGARQDPYANAHRLVVELDKPEGERGNYLHPELYGQPPERGIGRARRSAP
jgi:hypothetical protein